MKDPASANSVQLAKLDLFTQLDPSTQPTPSLLGSVCQLQKAASLAAEAGSGSAVLESVSALLRVLSNIVQHPAESKHRCLKMENAKIKAMLSGHDDVSILLRAIGMLQNDCTACKMSQVSSVYCPYCPVFCTQTLAHSGRFLCRPHFAGDTWLICMVAIYAVRCNVDQVKAPAGRLIQNG